MIDRHEMPCSIFSKVDAPGLDAPEVDAPEVDAPGAAVAHRCPPADLCIGGAN